MNGGGGIAIVLLNTNHDYVEGVKAVLEIAGVTVEVMGETDAHETPGPSVSESQIPGVIKATGTPKTSNGPGVITATGTPKSSRRHLTLQMQDMKFPYA